MCAPLCVRTPPISVFVAGCDGADPCNETQTTPTLAPALVRRQVSTMWVPFMHRHGQVAAAPAAAPAESAPGSGSGTGSGKGNGCRPRFQGPGRDGRRTCRMGGRGGRGTEAERRRYEDAAAAWRG